MRRSKAVLAMVGALLLVAHAASAGHDLQFDVSQSSYATNAYPDITIYVYFGTTIPLTMGIDIPAGYRVAHQTGAGAPWSSANNPSDEEQVGTGTQWARWQPLCFSESTLGLTLTWESTIPGTAPANTVSMLQMEAAGGLFTTDVFIVKEGTNDYRMEFPTMPTSSICSSTTQGLLQLTLWGDTPDGSLFIQNPATAGNYTWSVLITDSSGGTHTDSDTVVIT